MALSSNFLNCFVSSSSSARVANDAQAQVSAVSAEKPKKESKSKSKSKSKGAPELSFLEKDDNTPASSHAGSDGVNSLSVRTRAVAQFLKSHSPLSPIMDDEGDLSLNKILEGKTRKVSARMFYETLVLKSYGLVDVQQEEPYGDINLKLTPTLSKAQI